LALPLAVAGQNGDAPAADHSQHDAPAGEAAAGGHSMAAMHEHMSEMHEQMARIHATEDSDERQRLMHEHMQSMQQHMQMMGSMHGEGRPAGPSRCPEGDSACRMQQMRAEDGMTHERMRALEERLDSMQQLLQQMLEHQRAENARIPESRRDRRR
jgi:hypothetical protein